MSLESEKLITEEKGKPMSIEKLPKLYDKHVEAPNAKALWKFESEKELHKVDPPAEQESELTSPSEEENIEAPSLPLPAVEEIIDDAIADADEPSVAQPVYENLDNVEHEDNEEMNESPLEETNPTVIVPEVPEFIDPEDDSMQMEMDYMQMTIDVKD